MTGILEFLEGPPVEFHVKLSGENSWADIIFDQTNWVDIISDETDKVVQGGENGIRFQFQGRRYQTPVA